MEFTKHCENKEIITEALAEVFPVEEGWGVFISKVLGAVNPVAGVGAAAAAIYAGNNIEKALHDKKDD